MDIKSICFFIGITSGMLFSCAENAQDKSPASVAPEKTARKFDDTAQIRTYLLGGWVTTNLVNGLRNIDKLQSVKETFSWEYPNRSFSFDSLAKGKFVLYVQPEFERIDSFYTDRFGLVPVSDTIYKILYSPKDNSYLFFNTIDSTIELRDFHDASKVAAKYKKVNEAPLKTKDPVSYLVNQMLMEGKYKVEDAKGVILFNPVEFGEAGISGFGAFKNYQIAGVQVYKGGDGGVYPIVSLNVGAKSEHESLAYKKGEGRIYLYDYERPLKDSIIKLRGVKYVLTPL